MRAWAEAAIRAAVMESLEAAAVLCRRRYMGDNNREDMEARRCANAIDALRHSLIPADHDPGRIAGPKNPADENTA